MSKLLSVFVLLLCASSLFAQQRVGQRYNRAYATDMFEGFDALDAKSDIEQKTPSFWNSVDAADAAAQDALAKSHLDAGRLKAARKAYDALVAKWPTSPQAPRAQQAQAEILEKLGLLERAFDEYQYLLTYYAGHCAVYEILDRQFRIANSLLGKEKSFLGLDLGGADEKRRRFEQIVRTAPRAPKVPELLLVIGGIREEEGELLEAIAVYDGLINRFRESEYVPEAAYRSARCRRELSLAQNENEGRCRNTLAFLKSVADRMPNHPMRKDLQDWRDELTRLLIEQNYRKAVFYDTEQRNRESAKSAYRAFLKEFPDAPQAKEISERLKAVEAGAKPLRK